MTYQGPRILNNQKPPREKRKRAKTPAEKREGHPEYLEKLRQLSCCVCGCPPRSTVHHLKQTLERGGAMKSPDKYGLPMCMFPNGEDCHGTLEGSGSKNEIHWFQSRGVDPLTLANSLWNSRHDLDAMRNIIETHRRVPFQIALR